MTRFFLILALAALVATIFADAIPGAWWQWLATTVILICAAGMSEASDDA